MSMFVSNAFRRRQALRAAKTRPTAAATAPVAQATPAERAVDPVSVAVAAPVKKKPKHKKK